MRVTRLLVGALLSLFGALFVFPAGGLAQPAAGPAAEDAVDVPLCQLLADPPAYDHKLVRVTGRLVRGWEVFALKDPACPGSDKGPVPRQAHLELGGTVEGIETVLVRNGLLQKLHALGQAQVTLIGRYFSGRLYTWPNGRVTWADVNGEAVTVSTEPLRPLLVIQQVLTIEAAAPTP